MNNNISSDNLDAIDIYGTNEKMEMIKGLLILLNEHLG